MLDKYIQNPLLKEIAEWAVTILAALFIFFLIQAFLFRNADVSGDSMEPTFSHKDKVIVSRISYTFGTPHDGDVIVFPYKGNPKEYYIKRIIGLPGDEIDLRDFRFYINGQPLQDSFSNESIVALGNLEYPVKVPDGCYFVLGDNRNGSKDSRYSEVGFIPKKDIMGKVVVRIWPIKKFGLIR